MKNGAPALPLPKWLDARRGELLRVGFSGGADSTALLLALHEAGFTVEAVHFDHGLRGAASRADAAYCRAFAAARGIPFRLRELAVSPGPNLEARARAARLAAWRAIADEAGNCPVALGHHADDAIETLLMRLARGGNASSLAALRPARTIGGILFLRPMLACRRSEIEAYLTARGLTDWRRDATNQENHYLRNYLRNRLLPDWQTAWPTAVGGLSEAVEALRDDAACLEAAAKRALARCRRPGGGLAAEEFSALPAALRVRVLRGWLASATGREPAVRRALLDRLTDQARGRIPLDLATWLVRRSGVWYAEAREIAPVVWRWREEPEGVFGACRFTAEFAEFPGEATPDEAYFDADALPESLHLTARRRGDRLRVFGRGSEQPAKKFPPPPCVVRTPAGEIVWLPGVRHAAFAPVTAHTKRTVRLKLQLA